MLESEGCPELWQRKTNEQEVGVRGDVVVQTGERHLGHVHRLGGDVQHARLEDSLQEDLRQHLGVLHGLLYRIVLLGDAKVVAVNSPQVEEVAELLFTSSEAIVGVEEQEGADEDADKKKEDGAAGSESDTGAEADKAQNNKEDA